MQSHIESIQSIKARCRTRLLAPGAAEQRARLVEQVHLHRKRHGIINRCFTHIQDPVRADRAAGTGAPTSGRHTMSASTGRTLRLAICCAASEPLLHVSGQAADRLAAASAGDGAVGCDAGWCSSGCGNGDGCSGENIWCRLVARRWMAVLATATLRAVSRQLRSRDRRSHSDNAVHHLLGRFAADPPQLCPPAETCRTGGV